MRRTLGTAVFGGMLGVTLFGIFLTPVFYYVIQWLQDWRQRLRRRARSHRPRHHVSRRPGGHGRRSTSSEGADRRAG